MFPREPYARDSAMVGHSALHGSEIGHPCAGRESNSCRAITNAETVWTPLGYLVFVNSVFLVIPNGQLGRVDQTVAARIIRPR